jgi:hypothetical protein
MLETRIVMSLLIFHLILLLVFHLISFMDLTIAHTTLVHERIALCLDVLVTTHILIVVIVPALAQVFLRGSNSHFEPSRFDGPHFPRRGSRLTRSNGEVQRIVKTSSCCMVKC